MGHSTLITSTLWLFSNALKSWLVVKEGFSEIVTKIFSGTNVNIMENGGRFLGAAIGSRDFIESFVSEKCPNG